MLQYVHNISKFYVLRTIMRPTKDQVDNFLSKLSSTTRKRLIENVLEEDKPAVTEKHGFAYRNMWMLLAPLVAFRLVSWFGW